MEEAREFSVRSDFSAALSLVEKVIELDRDDIEALRLKGNILEQQVLETFELSSKKLLSIPGYLQARECYENILRLDSRNTLALLDLGDHYRDLDANDKAIAHYQGALVLLAEGDFRLNWEDEVNDLMDRGSELAKASVTEIAGKQIVAECERLLRSKGNR